jgi:hypothetical protein
VKVKIALLVIKDCNWINFSCYAQRDSTILDYKSTIDNLSDPNFGLTAEEGLAG